MRWTKRPLIATARNAGISVYAVSLSAASCSSCFLCRPRTELTKLQVSQCEMKKQKNNNTFFDKQLLNLLKQQRLVIHQQLFVK